MRLMGLLSSACLQCPKHVASTKEFWQASTLSTPRNGWLMVAPYFGPMSTFRALHETFLHHTDFKTMPQANAEKVGPTP